MLNLKGFLEPISTENLISVVYNYFLWKQLYTFLDRTLLKVKQAMKTTFEYKNKCDKTRINFNKNKIS